LAGYKRNFTNRLLWPVPSLADDRCLHCIEIAAALDFLEQGL